MPALRPDEGTPGTIRTGLITLLGAVFVAGCSLGPLPIPLASLEPERVGFKMLQPGVGARDCRIVWWPYGARSVDTELPAMLGELRGRNPEADTLKDVAISWCGVHLLVARAGCTYVRGDLGRAVPTVELPMLGDPSHHGHHH